MKNITIITIIFIYCLFFENITVSAGSLNTKNTTVTGNISYQIRENGDNKAKWINKHLDNYPFTLFYQDKSGKESHIELYTDANGDYTTIITSTVDIIKVWTEIRTDNDACLVLRKGRNQLPYEFTSNRFLVSMKNNFVHMNIRGYLWVYIWYTPNTN